MSELYDKCTFENWQEITKFPNYHELIKTALELFIKKQLDCQRLNLWKYACDIARKTSTDFAQFGELDKLFSFNKISPADFALAVKKILEKSEPKINCLRLIGVPNSCKSLLSNLIVEPFICCRMNNHGSENEFFMSNMLNKSIIQCEELYLTIATAEDFKSVLGGQALDIAKKFNEKQLLQRTPVVVTSNHTRFGRGHIPPVDENALAIRTYTYQFSIPYKPEVKIEWQQLYQYLLSYL